MDTQICFISLPDYSPPQDSLSEWLLTCSKEYNVSIHQLFYTFVDDQQMLDLNKEFLSHDTDTDIITFCYNSQPVISSEIYISTIMLQSNAKKLKVPILEEFLRLIIHGFLHSIGFKDSNTNEKLLMRKEEDKCINLFHVKHTPYV